MLKPFNSYTVYQPFGMDATVDQIVAMVESNYFPEGFPIDGDAMTIAIHERLGK